MKSNKEFIWSERKKAVDDLLKLYKNAVCVLTFRLHCALPCLAMETPVLVIRKNLDETRFTPYDQWLSFVLESDFLIGNYDYDIKNPPQNKKEYVKFRNTIIKEIEKFLFSVESKEMKAFDNYCDEREVNQWRVKNLRETCEEYRQELQKRVHELKRNNY